MSILYRPTMKGAKLEILVSVKAEHIGGVGSLIIYRTIYSCKFNVWFTVCCETHEMGEDVHGGYADLIVYLGLLALMNGELERDKHLMDELMSKCFEAKPTSHRLCHLQTLCDHFNFKNKVSPWNFCKILVRDSVSFCSTIEFQITEHFSYFPHFLL